MALTDALETLRLYMAYPFVRYALIAGVLAALCASMLGVPLVLKRFSFIGDGLSHVAFGALAAATVMDLSGQMLLVLPVTIIFAVLLLRSGGNTRLRGDAVLAMFSVGALALGYLLLNLFSVSTNIAGDVCSTLFGSASILTLRLSDVWLSAALSALVLIVFVLFYHRIFAVTFDEGFARATGTRVGAYNLLLAVVTAVVVVVSMKLVGSLLTSALIIFPPLSAMRVCRSFRAVTVCAAILAVICALVGFAVSLLASTPIGATIVAVNAVIFGVFAAIGPAFSRPTFS